MTLGPVALSHTPAERCALSETELNQQCQWMNRITPEIRRFKPSFQKQDKLQ